MFALRTVSCFEQINLDRRVNWPSIESKTRGNAHVLVVTIPLALQFRDNKSHNILGVIISFILFNILVSNFQTNQFGSYLLKFFVYNSSILLLASFVFQY